MTDRKTHEEPAELPPDDVDEPLTAGALVDAAIAKHELPKREGRGLDKWAASLSGAAAQAFGRELVASARVADYPGVRHFAHQAETAHLKDTGRAKTPDRS